MDTFEEKLNCLLADLFNSIGKLEETTLRESRIDASISEVHLMDAIGMDNTATVSCIAAKLGITPASVTVAVNKLESRGYVIKGKNPRDGRSTHISLAKEGIRVYRLHRFFHRNMVHMLTKNLVNGEKELLYDGFDRLNNFLKDSAKKRAVKTSVRPRSAVRP